MERLAAPSLPPWLDEMLPFRRYRLALGDQHVHVMESGEGLPVLLVHGNPSWGFLYRRVAQELRHEPLRVIMPDLVGLGLSDKPRDPTLHTLERHIGWMRELVKTLALERAVVGVQDWGGAIGIGALSELPDLRAGLVVMNTAFTPPRPGFRPTAFHRFAKLPLASDAVFKLFGFPQNTLAFAQGRRGSIRGKVARGYRYPLRRLGDRVAPLALARMVPDSFEHPSIEPMRRCQSWVERFEGPAAIVWGDRDPILGRVRGWMEKLFPGAPVTRTDGGHFLPEEEPRAIAEAVRDVASRLATG